MGYEILYSYRKVRFDIKRTRVLCDSYVLFEEASHTFWRMFMRFWYSSTGFFLGSNTATRDWSILIESKIQWKLLIHIYRVNVWYTYYQIEGMKKRVEGLTWNLNGKRINVQVFCPSKAINILFSVRFGHLTTLFSFIIFRSMKLML
jgi:hypothetical protein